MIIALPLAIGWTIYTAQPTPGNFLLGYVFSVSVLIATGLRGDSLRLRSAPRQLYNLVAYTVFLASEVLSAGVKVSRVILTPSLPSIRAYPRSIRKTRQKTSLYPPSAHMALRLHQASWWWTLKRRMPTAS